VIAGRYAPTSAGTSAIESTVALGSTPLAITTSSRYLPVRTRIPARPALSAPPMGRSSGRQWGVPMAAYGEIPTAAVSMNPS
jgi:hypothetical protein